ncbi:MAG TPA: GNAT family N-acetyltransferase [Solirubrobacteraceae bacterium]|nr:GNAT family N-acetyltransferase [Solirubrobacteraceae bacterium]
MQGSWDGTSPSPVQDRRYRRRGFATEIHRQSLIVTPAEGIDAVLVTCDIDNLASAAIIERLGGVMDDVRDDPEGPPKRRYWIR